MGSRVRRVKAHEKKKSKNQTNMPGFQRHKGKTKLMYFKGDTALQVREGSLVGLTDSGTVTPLRNDSTDIPFGVARRNDTTTDSAMVPIEVPVEDFVEWTFETDSDGGLADSDVGQNVAIDTTGGNSVLAGDSCATRVDVSDVTFPTVRITSRISATRGTCILVKRASTLIPDTGTVT